VSENNLSKISKKEALTALWEQGIVCEWMLDDNQKEIVKMYRDNPAKQQVIVFPRQCGKSWGCLTLAIEECLNNKNFVVTFVAPVQKQAKKIAQRTAREIFDTCPPHLRPQFKTQDNTFFFDNGSIIEILGNNAGNIENARGGKSHLIICDEVGFWDNLDYSIKSVLLPRTNTTKGKVILISTPPSSAGHPFQKFYEDASFRDAAMIRTIYDCPRFTLDDIDRFAEEMGGYDSIQFKREYLSEFIVDDSLAVIPEANDAKLKEIVKEWKRPPYFDTYVCMDLGFRDLTFIGFAYFDFRAGKIVIEDELVFDKPQDLRTDHLAYSIYDKEQELWQDSLISDDVYQPYMRVSDIDHFVLNDLYLQHGLQFTPTSKDNLDVMINLVRMMINEERIIIHPRCKNLIFHLQNATWKDHNRKTFSRSPDAGHYDGVAMLTYLVRNVQHHKNPYPADFDLNLNSNSFISPKYKSDKGTFKEGVQEIFSLKSTYKKR